MLMNKIGNSIFEGNVCTVLNRIFFFIVDIQIQFYSNVDIHFFIYSLDTKEICIKYKILFFEYLIYFVI